jgi:predicted small secreted protein
MKKITVLRVVLLGLVISAALSGCNTVAGAGKDISAGGHALTKAAN